MVPSMWFHPLHPPIMASGAVYIIWMGDGILDVYVYTRECNLYPYRTYTYAIYIIYIIYIIYYIYYIYCIYMCIYTYVDMWHVCYIHNVSMFVWCICISVCVCVVWVMYTCTHMGYYLDDTYRCMVVDITQYICIYNWLVVSTPLKNISQLGVWFPIYGKIKNVPNHQPDKYCIAPLFWMAKSPSSVVKPLI